MPKRSYDQYCAVARALDLVGERWTILVVRELLLGPKRYTDLLVGLPGIGPNVLADRLRSMQEAGLVRRRELPPPAASTVYELTPLGSGLRPAVVELMKWGFQFMGVRRRQDRFRPGWLLGAMHAMFRPEAARGVHDTYEFRIDGEAFHIQVDDGEIEVRQGSADDPDFVLTTDLTTFMAIGSRMLEPTEAAATGRAHVTGDLEAGRRSIEILGPHFGGSGPGGILGAVQSRVRAEATHGVRESYEFHVDDHVFHVRVDDGSAVVAEGAADQPALSFSTDLDTFLAIGAGQLTAEEAIGADRVEIIADAAVAARALAILDLV